MPKVDVMINSRQYTLVADENEEYIKKLAKNVNDKVKSVLISGQNVMGERPLVLAALNICDEYYKCVDEKDTLKIRLGECERKLHETEAKLKNAYDDLRSAKEASPQISFDEAEAEKKIRERDTKITSLEDRLRNAERTIEDKNKKIQRLEEAAKKSVAPAQNNNGGYNNRNDRNNGGYNNQVRNNNR